LLDLVEDPFDQVARSIQIRAETDRVFATSFRRNARPCALLAGKLPDPVGVVSAIREQHRLGKQAAEESRTQPVVMRLARREGEMHRQAIGVHHRVNLAGQAPSRATLTDNGLWLTAALGGQTNSPELSPLNRKEK
jgi:hypothetical protein